MNNLISRKNEGKKGKPFQGTGGLILALILVLLARVPLVLRNVSL